MPEPLLLRRASPADGPAVADVFWTSRQANRATIPALVHPRDDVVAHVVRLLSTSGVETWVAETTPASGVRHVVGALVVGPPDDGPAWVDQLYVAPAWTGHGIGTRLLDVARTRHPDGLQLWTFQSNVGARRFYARHGFVPVQWTDGDNEEHAPDVRMLWIPVAQSESSS